MKEKVMIRQDKTFKEYQKYLIEEEKKREKLATKLGIETNGINICLFSPERGQGGVCLSSSFGSVIGVFIEAFTQRDERGNIDERETENHVIDVLGCVISHELIHKAIFEEGIDRPKDEEEEVVLSVCRCDGFWKWCVRELKLEIEEEAKGDRLNKTQQRIMDKQKEREVWERGKRERQKVNGKKRKAKGEVRNVIQDRIAQKLMEREKRKPSIKKWKIRYKIEQRIIRREEEIEERIMEKKRVIVRKKEKVIQEHKEYINSLPSITPPRSLGDILRGKRRRK